MLNDLAGLQPLFDALEDLMRWLTGEGIPGVIVGVLLPRFWDPCE